MQDLRCFCRRQPILAKYGLGGDGKPFVHLKVHKQGRVYGEVVFTEGIVRIRCRECLRWYTVRIREPSSRVSVREEPLPQQISVG